MTLQDPIMGVSFVPDDDGNVVVAVQGEIDLSTADELWARVIEACTTWPGTVTVDLGEVSFMDSQGLRALMRAHKGCDLDATRLSIRSPQPQVRRLFEMTGLDTVLRIED